MDGFEVRRRTVAVLTVLALMPTSSAFAQSAGDNQYADPLVTEGNGQSGRQSPSSQGGAGDDTAAPKPPVATTPAPDTGSGAVASDAPSETALPYTGADPLALAVAGLALVAIGAMGLALPRRWRHARR